MAYRFVSDSTVEANVQRILGEQLEKAIQQLSEDFYDSPEQAIHKARKHLKKSRSVLRLVRKSIGKKTYQKENASLRDVGRSLAPARDGAVYPITLNTLLETYGLKLEVNGFSNLQENFKDLYQVSLDEFTDRDRLMTTVIDELKNSQIRLSHLNLKQSGWKAISRGLKQIYCQGQARFEAAYREGDDESFHEWRKRVKDLWHSTCLLRALWPPILDAFESEMHQLANLLGDDHDIAALRHFLLEPPVDLAVKDVHMQVLLPLMKHRQDKLHRQAKDLGHRLYGEKPAAFTHRFASYWRV
ncbi:CHAD domain-containing protein [Nodosilinea sp. PGN35]|uniref:CHAD domain-containing protein n=1 Tax=Nodosilinea sp. PGN35 TaxID=3020489 RepID=UPI0023B231FD|nr:CHAD domain-containing protein [Nodosilinea sp. TSF1-S3]MDF0366667.1 CHAD domain-containing protein [Nodosilinea sp. TSF1-S3]